MLFASIITSLYTVATPRNYVLGEQGVGRIIAYGAAPDYSPCAQYGTIIAFKVAHYNYSIYLAMEHDYSGPTGNVWISMYSQTPAVGMPWYKITVTT